MVKKILSILVWVVTAAGIVTLFIFSRNSYLETPLNAIDIQLERTHDKGFINVDSLQNDIDKICHHNPKGKIGSIDMCKIEKHLHDNPWIEDASTYIDLDGILHVNASEHEPVLRVYNRDGKSVYLTQNGKVVPISKAYTPRVLIANGHFNFPANSSMSDSTLQASGMVEALHIHQAIQNDKFLTASIGQIYRNKAGDFEIVVRDINAQVIVGDTCDIRNKLMKMKTFAQHKNGSEELRNYSKINLKYNNQIVCTKKRK